MITVNCDASIEGGNPGGHLVSGFVIKSGVDRFTGTVDLGISKDNTNNYGEYVAVLAALMYLVDHNIVKCDVIIQTDSKLVVKQLNNEWQCSIPRLIVVRESILSLLKNFNNVKFRWIPRNQNTEADSVSRSLYNK